MLNDTSSCCIVIYEYVDTYLTNDSLIFFIDLQFELFIIFCSSVDH